LKRVPVYRKTSANRNIWLEVLSEKGAKLWFPWKCIYIFLNKNQNTRNSMNKISFTRKESIYKSQEVKNQQIREQKITSLQQGPLTKVSTKVLWQKSARNKYHEGFELTRINSNYISFTKRKIKIQQFSWTKMSMQQVI